jgi:hypothetical protein
MDDALQRIDEAIAQIRKELRAFKKRVLLIFLVCALLAPPVVTFGLAYLSRQSAGELAAEIVIILSGAFILICFQILNLIYKRKTKKEFMHCLAEATNMSFSKKGVFPLSEIEKHKILPEYDSAHIEDGFEGAYKSIPIKLQEVVLTNLYEDSSSDGKLEEINSFWGLIIKLELAKKTHAHTFVIPSNILNSFYNKKLSDLKRVKLVSSEFEKKYDVFSTDQVEARVLMNPAFIERYIEAGDVFKAKWVECSFLEDELVFMVMRNKPLFEIGSLLRPLSENYLRKTARDLAVILRVIDVLELNPQALI